MSQNQLEPGKAKARDPPPSLFLHPSPGASRVSLLGANDAGIRVPSSSGITSNAQLSSGMSNQQSQPPPSLSRTGSLLNPRNRQAPRLQTGDSARTVDRTDALWAEMQATLEEAELSASGGTHVFGPDHDQKLAELRAAQIALAQAWARSETDDAATSEPLLTEGGLRNMKGVLGDVGGMAAAVAAGAALGATIPSATAKGTADADVGKSTIGTGSARPGSSGLDGEKLGAKLEEETERDILLARNRREANDHYFSKVDRGVRDVVAKLEEVAIAMKAVEQETRAVWGEETPAESTDT